ncbi:MAG: hypothetical protein ACRDQ2_13705 [Gaiellales bacterium]
MNRLVIVSALVAAIVGLSAGFLWWGRPTARLQTELSGAQTSADQLTQQVDELRRKNQGLTTQLETVQRDLGREREMNSRLHLLVSEGKK